MGQGHQNEGRRTVLGRPPAGTWGEEELRTKFVIVARKMFSERGYADVSVRDVANACGVTPAAIHYYFKSKATLYMECHLLLLKAATERATDIVNGSGGVLEKLHRVCYSHVVDVAELSGIWAQLPQVELVDQSFRNEMAALRRAYVDIIQELVQASQSIGAFRSKVNARHAAHHLIGALNHIPRWRRVEEETGWDPALLELFELFGFKLPKSQT